MNCLAATTKIRKNSPTITVKLFSFIPQTLYHPWTSLRDFPFCPHPKPPSAAYGYDRTFDIMIFNSKYNKKYVLSNLESVQCNFSFLITRRSSSSKSDAVYKISSKSDDFSLRYGDISIFKMAAVRHLGIVLPPYETPTTKLHQMLLAAAACQISCQSDAQI